MDIELLLKKLIKREVSATEITKSYLEKAENEDLNSYITITKDKALKQAKIADLNYKNNKARPLEGIPFGIKDLYCTKDIKTTAGSKILSNFIPFYESTLTKKLWDAGAILIGKTNLDEFAMGNANTNSYYGVVKNPWKKDYVPGGSSGGSAACVAADLACASLGTDTGGSIRQPAAFCGVVGIKPTYGLCSRFGIIAYASSLDQGGPITKTVKDAAIVLENIAGYDNKDATSLNISIPQYSKSINPDDIKGKKIVVFNEFLDGLKGEQKKLLERGIKLFEENGAEIHYLKFPLLSVALPVYYIIAPAEASSNLARYDGIRFGFRAKASSTIDELYTHSRDEGFGMEVKRRILMGTYILAKGHYDSYYLKAQSIRCKISSELNTIFEKYDLILSPTTPTTAFPIDKIPSNPKDVYLNDIYTVTVNLAGLPAISVPISLSKNGLPMGLQLIGPKLGEQLLFNAGQFLENHSDKSQLRHSLC